MNADTYRVKTVQLHSSFVEIILGIEDRDLDVELVSIENIRKITRDYSSQITIIYWEARFSKYFDPEGKLYYGIRSLKVG